MALAKRRTVLLGVGAAGVSAAVAACGSNGEEPSGAAKTSTPPAESPTEDGGALAKLSDVPEGGGVVLKEQDVVLTQPTQGEIKGFSATCTHKACTLADVKDGTINCTCHGSKFSVEDGSVKNGPATKPLPTVEVKVEGEEILRA